MTNREKLAWGVAFCCLLMSVGSFMSVLYLGYHLGDGKARIMHLEEDLATVVETALGIAEIEEKRLDRIERIINNDFRRVGVKAGVYYSRPKPEEDGNE